MADIDYSQDGADEPFYDDFLEDPKVAELMSERSARRLAEYREVHPESEVHQDASVLEETTAADLDEINTGLRQNGIAEWVGERDGIVPQAHVEPSVPSYTFTIDDYQISSPTNIGQTTQYWLDTLYPDPALLQSLNLKSNLAVQLDQVFSFIVRRVALPDTSDAFSDEFQAYVRTIFDEWYHDGYGDMPTAWFLGGPCHGRLVGPEHKDQMSIEVFDPLALYKGQPTFTIIRYTRMMWIDDFQRAYSIYWTPTAPS